MAKVSIQGYEGSFHQVAAQLFYGKDVEVICCDTFRDVVKIASNKKLQGSQAPLRKIPHAVLLQ